MNQPKLPADVQWAGPEAQAAGESGLVHAAYLPEAASPTRLVPLVVMIHGWAGDESVTWIFRQTVPTGVALVTPRAPLSLPEGGFAWFHYQDDENFEPIPESFTEAMNSLQQFLARLPDLYPVDPARIVLMGFSQGAMMGNAFTLTHPSQVQGMVSLAGAIPQVPELMNSSISLGGLPVFIAHGTRDETVPLKAAQQTRDLYHRLGAEVTYGEYEAAHKMSSQGMKDLKAWFSERF